MKLLFKRIGVDKRNDMLFVQLAQEGIEIEIKTSLGKRSSNTFRKDAKGIHKEPRLVQVLALAHHIHQLVLNQKIDEDLEIAKYLNVSRTRLNQIYQFINLSPVIQESILSGRINNIHQISETQLREVAKQPSWIQQSIEWEKITL